MLRHLEFVQRILLGIFLVRLRFTYSIIFCEANAIYGIIIAVVLINKISVGGYDEFHNLKPDFDYPAWYYAGYAVFASGLSVGVSNLFSG